MIISYERGHPIFWDGTVWRFADSGEPTAKYGGVERRCARCGRLPGEIGEDACMGIIPGAKSVCCGHGVELPYIVWDVRSEAQQVSNV